MNQFFKKAVVLFALISSISVFSQEQPFSPKFTLGSGFYTLTGDIQNENSGFLNRQYEAGPPPDMKTLRFFNRRDEVPEQAGRGGTFHPSFYWAGP